VTSTKVPTPCSFRGHLLWMVFGLGIAGGALSACTFPLQVQYQPPYSPEPLMGLDATQATLFLPPVEDQRANQENLNTCRATNAHTYVTGRSPRRIVREALVEELGRMGITVEGSPNEAQGTLKATLKTFEFCMVPEGYFGYANKATFVAEVAVFRKGTRVPLWTTRLSSEKRMPLPFTFNTAEPQYPLSEALTEAISQLRRQPGFAQAVASLARAPSPLPDLQGAGGKPATIIEDLAQELSIGIQKHHIIRIAVLPLYDASHEVNRPLGNYLTEILTNKLYKTGSAKVVERAQLNKVIEELRLTMSGRFDDASVQRIGQLLGVDGVIVGSYTELGTHTVEVNSRVIHVETGEIVGARQAPFKFLSVQLRHYYGKRSPMA